MTKKVTLCLNAMTYHGEQRWRSGESARLTPLWPGFYSASVPYKGAVCCWFSPCSRVFYWFFSFPPSTKFFTPNSTGTKADVPLSLNIVIYFSISVFID